MVNYASCQQPILQVDADDDDGDGDANDVDGDDYEYGWSCIPPNVSTISNTTFLTWLDLNWGHVRAADNEDSSDYKVSLANLIDNGRRVAKVARLWLIMQSNNQPVGWSIYKQAVSLSVMCCVF